MGTSAFKLLYFFDRYQQRRDSFLAGESTLFVNAPRSSNRLNIPELYQPGQSFRIPGWNFSNSQYFRLNICSVNDFSSVRGCGVFIEINSQNASQSQMDADELPNGSLLCVLQ